MSESALITDSEFERCEPDKLVDSVTFERCRFNSSLYACTGINRLRMVECDAFTRIQLYPRTFAIEQSRFYTTADEWGALKFGARELGMWPLLRGSIKRCEFFALVDNARYQINTEIPLGDALVVGPENINHGAQQLLRQ